MKYRCIISILFCILFLVPITLLKDHSITTIKLEIDEKETALRSSLMNEAAEYTNDLQPSKRIEKILNEIEVKLNFVSSSTAHIQLTTGKDPNFINDNFIPKLRHILLTEYGIKPLCVFASDCDFRNFYSWYNEGHFSHLTAGLKSLIPKILLTGTVNELNIKSFLNNASFIAYYKNLLKKIIAHRYNNFTRSQFIPKTPSDIMTYYMRKYFSTTYFITNSNRHCKVYSSKKFKSKLLFIYNNQIRNQNAYAGSYIIIFSDKNFNYKHLIALEENKNNNKYQRRLWKCNDKYSGKFIENSDRLFYISPLPTSLLISSETELSKTKLIVFVEKKHLTHKLATYQNIFKLIYKLTILIFFTLISYYVLFGFSVKGTIKQKIICTISIILLVPYASLGYFSNLIITLTNKSEKKQLQIEAKAQLYEFTQLLKDAQLRFAIAGIELKQNLLPLTSRTNLEKNIPVIPSLKQYDIEVVLCNKQGEVYCIIDSGKGKINKIREAKLIDLLNNFGVLDPNSLLGKKKLKKAMFADGISKNFNSSKTYASEAALEQDIADLSGTRSMLLLLLPRTKAEKSINAIALVLFKKQHPYLNDFDRLTPIPSKMLTSKSERFTSYIAAAFKTKAAETDFETIPSHLEFNNPLTKFLRKAMKNKNTRSLTNPFDITNSCGAWTIKKDKSVSVAVLTTLHSNLLSKFSIKLFPFILLIISLLSIFLVSDLISEMIAKPLMSFIRVIDLAKSENYNTRITLASQDEFFILGNALNMMITGLLQRIKIKRFVSGRLFDKVDSKTTIHKPERTNLVVLSSDIRNFTTISEQHDPSEIVNLLNDYFTEMEKAIIENNGIIEKFIGDALMAIFYQDKDTNKNSQNAVNAALQMRISLSKLNSQRTSQGKFCIEHGIGIATGKAVAGIISSNSGRKEFTVFGEIVTRADKLEAMTKYAKHTKIAICAQSYIELNNYYNFEVIKENDIDIAYEVINEK